MSENIRIQRASDNRLQFAHKDYVFETKEAAKQFVESELAYSIRNSLFAEPIVLKYGTEEDPKIILGIGATNGDVENPETSKTFWIDAANIEEKIQELEEAIEEIEKKTNIVAVPSNTLNLVITEDAETSAKTISGDVKIPSTAYINGNEKENQIITGQNLSESGIFMNVDMGYSGNGDTLKLIVNGEPKKEISLPKETHVVSGEYDQQTENIVLTLSDDTSINIDVRKLAAEIRVETPRTSPIELKIQRITGQTVDDDDEYKSILSAKVYVSQESDNILKIVDDGESDARLYVKGTADNIIYGNSTVKDALDTINGNGEGSIAKAVADEEARATSVENEIISNVSTISGNVADIQNTLDSEIEARELADIELTDRINRVDNYAQAVSGAVHTEKYEVREIIRNTSEYLENKIEDTAKELTLDVENPESNNLKLIVTPTSNGTKINGYVSVYEGLDNIIEGGNSVNGTPLYAYVKLDYSKATNTLRLRRSGNDTEPTIINLNNADLDYDNTRNVLKYTYTIGDSASASTMATKEFKLNSFGVVDHIDYNSELEQLEIYYKDASGEMQKIDVPVGDLFNELTVENTNTVNLTKERKVDGSDVLSADVNISQNTGNILSARNDGLYVPESAITANTRAIAELSGKTTENTSNISAISATVATQETRIETLENNSSSTEDELNALTERVTSTEERLDVLQGNALVEGSVAKSVADALAESKEYTDEKVADVTLEGSSAITVDYSNKTISLKINSDLNSESYLKSSENGIYVSGVNDAIDAATSGKANSSDVYTKTESDDKFTTKEETSEINDRLSDAETNISALENSVASIGSNLSTLGDRVSANESVISTLNGNELQEGSVSYTAKQYADAVKDYTDSVKDELNNKIDTVESEVNDKIDAAQAEIDESVKEVVLNKHLDNELTYDLVYTLNNGVAVTGGTLNIPKDKFLKSVTYDPSTHKLIFVFNVESGTTTEEIDISDLIDTYYGSRTITIDRNNVIEVKVCGHEHNQYLNVCEEGLYVGGVDEAIAAATSGKADASDVYTKTEADELFAKETDFESLIRTVGTNSSDIATLKENVRTLSSTTESMPAQILSSANTYTDQQVDELREEISGSTGDIAELRNELIATSGILQSEIDEKANASDVYTKAEVDEMIGEIPSYDAEIAALSGQVQTVSGTANNALDLANEIKLKYNWIVADTNTVDLTKSESTNSGSTLSANVNISTTEGNALTANTSGLFVGLSKLTYSTAGNELTFTNAKGENTVIQLNSVDVVKNIYYDGESDELVFVYTADGVEKTTRISAAAFFKGIVGTYNGNVEVTTALTPSGSSQNVATAITANLDVNNIIDNTNGNVTLEKTNVNNKIQANLDVNKIVSTGNSLTKYVQVEFRKTNDNKILGYVGISTFENNVLDKDSENELFVPKEASNYTCIYSGETTTVQEAISQIEEQLRKINAYDNLYQIIGVNSGDTTIAPYLEECKYVSGDSSVVKAIVDLDKSLANSDEQLFELSGAVLDLQSKTAISGIDSDSIDITIETTSERTDVPTTIKADVVLSTDETNSTNLLTIENDGLRMDSVIDCGEYY